MAHRYYVNKNSQSNGDHEVHVSSCARLPNKENQLALGEHDSCRTAVTEAKKSYTQSNGCYYCCNPCHKG